MSVINSYIQPDSLSNIISRSPLMRMVASSAARSPCARRVEFIYATRGNNL